MPRRSIATIILLAIVFALLAIVTEPPASVIVAVLFVAIWALVAFIRSGMRARQLRHLEQQSHLAALGR